MIVNQSTITLYNHADDKEGRVEARPWGWCTSEHCARDSHDLRFPHFTYFATVIEGGEVVWQGECGEQIVRSPLGRWFYTTFEPNRPYDPWTITRELQVEEGVPVLPADLWCTLIIRYGSGHKTLTDLLKIAKVEEVEE
jgi:hypothetical protein